MADDDTVSYGRDDLLDVILAALREAGVDLDALTVEDLAPVDQFHSRGLEATLELFELLGLAPGQHVLDIGSGIGGPARWLAAKHGCRVTGIDLTEGFCAVARELTARLGLEDRIAIEQGDARDLPFADASFDAVLCQNVAMNIADKARLYAEAFRVARPGARFGLMLYACGDAGDPIFPVPWADEPGASHLPPVPDIVGGLEDAGFRIVSLIDRTADAIAHAERMKARIAEEGPPVLGIHLLMGEGGIDKARNSGRSVAEGRTRPLEILARRPG